jgi:hypothetical protein
MVNVRRLRQGRTDPARLLGLDAQLHPRERVRNRMSGVQRSRGVRDMSEQLFMARVSSKAGRGRCTGYISPPDETCEAATADALQARPRARGCSTSRAGFSSYSGRVEDLHSDIRWHGRS